MNQDTLVNDYTNHYIHTQQLPTEFIANLDNPFEGYPRLQKLIRLKEANNSEHFPRPFGHRVAAGDLQRVLNDWIHGHKLLFDTIMIGSVTENQFDLETLKKLPIESLCSRPGFLYIWGTGDDVAQIADLLDGKIKGSSWGKQKFRRSEVIVYSVKAALAGDESMLVSRQWQCWMCITGTVRRTEDAHLINCNINTDLKIQSTGELHDSNCVPDSIYKIIENFSSGNRRLHIVPSTTGTDVPVKLRPGWVIASPDVLLSNFSPKTYMNEIINKGFNVPQVAEVEQLRPKSRE